MHFWDKHKTITSYYELLSGEVCDQYGLTQNKHKTITSYYELLSGEVCDQYGLTQMEYDILMFLHDNPQYNTAKLL